MTGMPLVSVVIPCYNYARYLPQAVGSALSQRGVRTEVIVVDDKSTDESLAVAQRLAADNPAVTVLANQRNGGMVETFNRGLARATGEFMVRLDADDLLTPGALARAVDVFRAHPRVGLVYGHPLHFEGAQLPRARSAVRGWTIWPGLGWLEDRCTVPRTVITSPEVVMRAETVALAGPQVQLRHTPDMEMWLRMATFGDIAFIRGADQAWHREHPLSMSVTETNEALDIVERHEMFGVLFSGPAAMRSDAPRLHRLSRRGLAAEAIERASREYDRGRGDSDAAREYVRIAGELIPDIETVAGWAGLHRRMRRGPEASARLHHSLVPRLRRRAAHVWSDRRWRREGVL